MATINHTIELMKESKIRAVSETLTRAFMNDPLQTYTFPDEVDRRKKSPDHFAALLQFGQMFGEVYTLENAEGALVLLRPNETEITPEKAEQGGLGKLPELLGEDATKRFFSVLDFIDPYHKEDVPEPHWYVMVVGVDPAFQGKGFGKALLMPVIETAGLDKKPVYLETAQPTNIPFYIHLGFRVIRNLREPVSGLDLWTFKLDH